MGSKKNKKMSRSSAFKKRLFQGNKHTKTIRIDGVSSLYRPNVQTQPNEQAETSQGEHHEVEGTPPYKNQKFAIHDERNDLNNEGCNNYFVFINMSILVNLISSLGKCPECSSAIGMIDLLKLRMSFAHKIIFTCTSCSWEQSVFLSEQCSPATSRGRNFFEINVRSLIAFREIGKGHQAIRCFSRCMNMKSISKNGYSNLIKDLYDAYQNAADASKSKAALETKQSGLKEVDGKHLCQCSWQKQGHASLNGVVTAIASGTCLDTAVFAKNCKSCQKWQSRKGTPEYESWFADHDCKINHKKSSGSMEAAGAVKIFCDSVEKHGLIYENYIRDGDTTSFKEVVDAKPYEKYGITPKKLECVGHIQKRLGNRLRVLRKYYQNSKTPLSGRGKLTDKVINSLQNYFGLAITQNSGYLCPMKATGAVLWHSTEFADKSY